MFERFTERARQVVVLSQDEASRLKHNHIGTEHLLLGLLREEEGIAARVLESLAVTLEEVRVRVVEIIGEGDEIVPGGIPFTPRARKVLELSLREALSIGHNYVGTEHILLGLVREGEGVANRVLLDLGADSDRIYDEVIRALPDPATAAGRRRRASRPPRWEYRIEAWQPGGTGTLERLNELGAEGWELIGDIPAPDGTELVLRRPVLD